MLSDLTKSSGRDALESKFWFLDAKNKESYSSSINNSLSKFMSMLSNASKSPCSSFFDRGIELLKAVNKSI